MTRTVAGRITHTFRRTAAGLELFYGWFEAMHSRMDLLIAGFPEREAGALAGDAAREALRLEKRLNRFDPGSDLYRINAGVRYGRCYADAEMRELFAGAQRYRELTEGAFDVCAAAGRPRGRHAGAGYTVDEEAEAIVFDSSEPFFDFGGYAKGYALERVRNLLLGAGTEHALVSFGNSSVCGIGSHPAGNEWRVGVENPLRKGENMCVFPLMNAALSSSGNIPGNRGHIVCPGTGEAVEDDRIVSVAACSALDCEVLSTALFAVRDPQARKRITANFRLQRVVEMEYTLSGVRVWEPAGCTAACGGSAAE